MSQIMELFIMVNGQKMDLEMVKVRKFGRMVQSILVIGKMIKLMEKEGSSTQMEMFMKVTG